MLIMYDISIIGAGVIGCAIARELSKHDLKICLIEKNEDISTETSKANSGIVHGGYDAKHGTLKAKFCAKGNQLFQKLDKQLHFGFKKVGSLVVGFNKKDKKIIHELYANGLKNGVKELKIVDGAFVKKKEPHLNPKITVALYCGSAGIVSPYEFTIALAENAVENGVDLKLNTPVVQIEKNNNHFILHTSNHNHKTIKTKRVINAAGLYSDHIANMLGMKQFKIMPRRGEYLLFDKDQGNIINSVIFQTPSEAGKGVLVTKTYHGNLMIGPSSTYIDQKDDLATTSEVIDSVIVNAKKTLPHLNLRKVITSFSGNRATSNKHDFIIEESDIKGFINVAGIESPGLTAAPAIALRVVEMVKESSLALKKKAHFNPYRKPYYCIAQMKEHQLNQLVKKQPAYGRIICRCEMISEGEILDAINRPIPIHSLDAIKRRTRAGMGRCQGGFCSPKIMEIIYHELGIPIEKINKKAKGSYMVVGRTKRALQNNEKL